MLKPQNPMAGRDFGSFWRQVLPGVHPAYAIVCPGALAAAWGNQLGDVQKL